MTPLLRNMLILGTAMLAAAGGYFMQRHTGQTSTGSAHVARDAGTPILALTLPDTKGTLQALEQWRGKVLVVNFWATWCPPCLREIPDFAKVSRRFTGAPVQFVGISIDKPDNVRKFATELQVPYPLLIAPLQTLEITAALGNTAQALPFTAIFDQRGEVEMIRLGTLNEVEQIGRAHV